LKLVMKLLVTMRENTYANGADAQARLLFRARSARSMAGHKKAQRRRAPTSSGRAKSSPRQTRMLRLLYTTSILFKTPQTDGRWKREQAYDDPFRHRRD